MIWPFPPPHFKKRKKVVATLLLNSSSYHVACKVKGHFLGCQMTPVDGHTTTTRISWSFMTDGYAVAGGSVQPLSFTPPTNLASDGINRLLELEPLSFLFCFS